MKLKCVYGKQSAACYPAMSEKHPASFHFYPVKALCITQLNDVLSTLCRDTVTICISIFFCFQSKEVLYFTLPSFYFVIYSFFLSANLFGTVSFCVTQTVLKCTVHIPQLIRGDARGMCASLILTTVKCLGKFLFLRLEKPVGLRKQYMHGHQRSEVKKDFKNHYFLVQYGILSSKIFSNVLINQ